MTTMIGRYALGTKTDSLQEPGLLGYEYTTDVFIQSSVVAGMIENVNCGPVVVKLVQNTSGAVLQPGELVMPDVAGSMDTNVVKASAGATVMGIVDPFLTEDVADDERFLIIVKASRIPARSGAAFTKGDRLLADAVGKSITGVGTTMRALEDATAADELVDVSCNFSAQ